MLFVAAHILTYIRKICHSHTTKVLNHVKQDYIKTHLSILVQPTLKKGDFFARQITLEVDDFVNENDYIYIW